MIDSEMQSNGETMYLLKCGCYVWVMWYCCLEMFWIALHPLNA